MQRETHVGSYLILWQMFSNIKMKFLCKTCWRQISGINHEAKLNSFAIFYYSFCSASKLLVSDKKLSDPACLFMWNTYPWDNHQIPRAYTQARSATAYTFIQQNIYLYLCIYISTYISNRLYIYIFPIYSSKMIYLWWAADLPFIKMNKVHHTLWVSYIAHMFLGFTITNGLVGIISQWRFSN